MMVDDKLLAAVGGVISGHARECLDLCEALRAGLTDKPSAARSLARLNRLASGFTAIAEACEEMPEENKEG